MWGPDEMASLIPQRAQARDQFAMCQLDSTDTPEAAGGRAPPAAGGPVRASAESNTSGPSVAKTSSFVVNPSQEFLLWYRTRVE